MISDEHKQHIVWNSIKINNDVYMISVTQQNDVIQVFLTNLIEIWMETLTNEIILDRCRKLNPLLNVEALNYKDVVLKTLSDISKYINEASIEHIKLRTQIEGGIMKFAVNLTKGTCQDFWEIITKPLCISSMEMIRQHEFLLDLIKKKDEEIAEYKRGGAELIRKNIETKAFTEEQFKIHVPTPSITDCTNAFQRMVNLYNELNLFKCDTSSTEPTSSSSSNSEIQRMEQGTTTSVQNDNTITCKNEDVSMQQNIEAIHSENETQNKDTINKKLNINRTRTTNMVYRPFKKIKKELEHLPEMLPRRENNKIKRKRCRQCTAKGLRKETNYFCCGCKDNPGLCLGKCFKEYHNPI